ncbi:MAG: class I SAM-dependent methyltransferase [Candidatus Hydrogenedentes bacterium]|nr:class I SAM-dependent methyltransferase [Candidatus Hydrogenedentota bacterium]
MRLTILTGKFMTTMDERLLGYYLACEDSEAGPWNRSPRSLYIEYWTRAFIAGRIRPFSGMQVCNVGIGAGGWDNFLCDLLDGIGRVTSVDIDRGICELFRYRQEREGHRNPSTVVCADILTDSLTASSFDVVTVIGSTVRESGNYSGCLSSCWRLVRNGGFMMYMDFFRTPSEQFEAWAASGGAVIEEYAQDNTVSGYASWVRREDSVG